MVGNRLQTVYGGTGRTITSTYDACNRLSTMAESGRTTSYGYDLDGNISQKVLPNGDKEVMAFDALNRTSSQTATTSGNASLYTFNYGYDWVGNVLTDQEQYPSGLANRTVTNTYDGANRLTQEAVSAAVNVTTAYTYDLANNRTSQVVTGGTGAGTTNYSYNALNQLTSWTLGTATTGYTYDLDGNRSTRTQGGATDTYSYDFENRLIGLVKNTTGGTGTYAYKYDYRTRRIVRDESGASGVVTNLVFSGGTSVQEYAGAISSADLTVEFVRGSDYGGGVGGILYSLRSGTPSYTHQNRRGDVVAKTSAAGSLTYQAQYQAFGQQTASTGSTLDRQKSNSKDTDPTNLVCEGFRYRDLETGMFVSRDPAGFVDGPNLYTYVVQNPWTKFDPEGLRAETDAEKNAVSKMNTLADSVSAQAKDLRQKAADAPKDKKGLISLLNQQADDLDKNAAGIKSARKQFEEQIAAVKEHEEDPASLKLTSKALTSWADSATNESFNNAHSTKTSQFTTLPAGKDNCNFFVGSTVESALGIDIGKSSWWHTWPPTANDWGHGRVPGFTCSPAQQVGDGTGQKQGSVIAFPTAVELEGNHRNEGHCGITLGSGMYVSSREGEAPGQASGIQPQNGLQIKEIPPGDPFITADPK